MKLYEFIAPCHFGLEAVLKREINDLGYEISKVEDGKVTFLGDEEACAYANMFLRTTERILWKVGEFKAETFDELFENTKALPWEEFIPKDGKFWVAKANSVKSKLFSPSDIQSIMKKAVVDRLKTKYKTDWFEESGESYPIRVAILKDVVTIGLDTTGVSLHKRGYRKHTVKAPITETLAAALLMLTPWKGDRILVDPFCGSGTFAIEAAMMAADMAPGIKRDFLSEAWTNIIPAKCWSDAREEANDRLDLDIKTDIQGYDIDPEVVSMARENAKLAGVEKLIHLQQRDVAQLSHPGKYGFIITNPPYGERLVTDELADIYKTLGERFARLDTWSMYLITSYEDAQRYIGRTADKNRKIYNGMMKTYFYQYSGPKPPKRTQQ
jgi:putative N6-adenine-specific DNA methylase